MVQRVSGVGGRLLSRATHAGAWQGAEGPQSASVRQGSSLTAGVRSWHRNPSGGDPAPGGSSGGGSLSGGSGRVARAGRVGGGAAADGSGGAVATGATGTVGSGAGVPPAVSGSGAGAAHPRASRRASGPGTSGRAGYGLSELHAQLDI